MVFELTVTPIDHTICRHAKIIHNSDETNAEKCVCIDVDHPG